MKTKTYPIGSQAPYRYVVTLSRYQGRWLLSRQKGKTTWEFQGGHIEPGETPEQAARRELWEESGAAEFSLAPWCDYRGPDGSAGQVFQAEIRRLGPLPDYEIEEVRTFLSLPEMTYPEIAGVLLEKLEKKK